MKQKTLYIILACEAVLCILLYFAREALPQVFGTVIAFPFRQIAMLLRTLSLSGSLGNAISIILYAAICLVPAFVLFYFRKKRKLYAEDALLAVLSAVLFIVIYLMINPGLLGTYLGIPAGQSVSKPLLGGIVYSVLVGYVLLRIMRLFFSAETFQLQKYLMVLLYLIIFLLVFVIFGTQFSHMLDSFEKLRTDNIGNEYLLGTSYIFLVLEYLVNALPYALVILVVFGGQNLLKELSIDRYSEKSVVAAEKLSHICGLALIITVLSNMVFNLLQLVLIKMLLVVNGAVQIPLFSIAFVLAALLLAQYIRENKQLKDANDMFV
ncbi:MAG: hypothetical protein ACOYIF_05095 [Acetivibrionales bacterium]|jgi:hypothetical protein